MWGSSDASSSNKSIVNKLWPDYGNKGVIKLPNTECTVHVGSKYKEIIDCDAFQCCNYYVL